MKELRTSELVEVSGGEFHIFAQDGGNPGKNYDSTEYSAWLQHMRDCK